MKLRLILAAVFALTTLSLRAEDPASFEVGGRTFTRPSAWQWVPVSSPMRKAQLKVPGKQADEWADVTFFHFGAGMGGGVQANAQRWLAQFESKDAGKIEPQEIAGAKVTLVTTEGTFRSGMPGGPTAALENYALLGAIIEGSDGDIFVKMTGPASIVKEQQKAFLDFISAAVAPKK